MEINECEMRQIKKWIQQSHDAGWEGGWPTRLVNEQPVGGAHIPLGSRINCGEMQDIEILKTIVYN